eukprot:2816067-Prorocentrum_lima.AAC.1
MTSSLVGSEMCIRDRKKHWGAKVKAPKSKGHEMSSTQAMDDRSSPQSLFCLLYTSDAADDM